MSFVANSPLNAVFTFTLPCLSIVSRTRSSIISLASSKKSLRLNVIRIYHSCRYTAFKRGVAREIFRRNLYSRTRHQRARNVAPIALLHPRDPRHRRLSVSNGETRTLGTTKFFEPLVASLQPHKTLHQSRDLAALFQQFVPLARDFSFFFTVFRSRHSLP